MTQFKAGQEVQVWGDIYPASGGLVKGWQKAKIINILPAGGYKVLLRDSWLRCVFEEEHIKCL